MAFDAHVLKVLIASPGDTGDERDAVEGNLHGWNAARAEREQVILLPRRWETDSVPRLGGSGQGVINEQLVDDADIVVALFDSRLGQATEAAVSGTAEEIQRAHAAGKPVHVYFSNEPLPRNIDPDQLRLLNDFKTSLQQQGLFGSYADPADLGYQVRNAIEADLPVLGLGPVELKKASAHALLTSEYQYDREQYLDGRGKVLYRNRRSRMEVRNTGAVLAKNIRFTLVPLDENEAPSVEGPPQVDIAPGSSFTYPILWHMGIAAACQITYTWDEDDGEHTSSHSISF
jgi:hypothetical protein